MNNFENIYEPCEDSFLLTEISIDEIKKLNKTNLYICEVGVGSGYNILNIAKKYPKNNFYGTDINKFAIDFTKKEFKKNNLKIDLKNKSLISGFKKKFDLIIFNTPYLPLEDNEKYDNLSLKEKAIYGGEKGYEVIVDFIYEINDKLKNEGFVLMIFSSYSNLNYITEVLKNNFFEFEILKEQSHFFEKLYCIKIIKSDLLKQLSINNISEIKYFSSGKHSKVFSGKLKNKEIIIKFGKQQFIQKEVIYLKKLQKTKFVPKLYFYDKEYVVMEKLKGELIEDFIEKSNKKKTLIVMQNLIDICYQLDKKRIQKFELINPKKHTFIDKNLNIKFIDFERSIFSISPKNTTQILEYFRRIIPILEKKNIILSKDKIFEISKRYKLNNFKIKINDLF